MEAVVSYADKNKKCRSQTLLAYFGDTDTQKCKQCDVCLDEKEKTLHVDEFEAREQQVYDHLKGEISRQLDIEEKILDQDKNLCTEDRRELVDHIITET